MTEEIENTRKLNICKAFSVDGEPIPNLEIHFKEPSKLEVSSNSLQEWMELFEKEAKALAEALLKTLPGGIIDRLLAELLIRRGSLLAIPLFQERK